MPDRSLGLIHTPRSPLLPRLSKRARLPDPKPEINWHTKIKSLPMLANDSYGDCVPAGMLHAAQLRMANAWGSKWEPTDDMALRLYGAWNPGFNPDDPSTDIGTDVPTAMRQWTTNGIDLELQAPDCGWHLAGDPLHLAELKLGIEWFGAALVSANLPASAETQLDAGLSWTVENSPDAEPGTWGLHFFIIGRYDPERFYGITWGAEQAMSVSWLLKYMVAVDFCASPSWLDATGMSPPGLSRDQLAVDMAAIAAAV